MKQCFELSIIIPCYNEAERINLQLYDLFLNNVKDTLICFVNDGSTDQTVIVLQALQKKYPTQVHILSTSKNSGKATAVREGMCYCTQNFNQQKIAYLDADLATSLEECKEINLQVNSKIVLAFGSRISKIDSLIERKFYRFLIGRILATAISNQLKLPVYDTQCGCKIFTNNLASQVFQEKFISKWLFDVEIFYRIIDLYSVQEMKSICKEVPLKKWIDIGDSKVKFSYLFKLWLDLFFIAKKYKKD
jgi:glycosyltransferase involved in cell wall biosynthesis